MLIRAVGIGMLCAVQVPLAVLLPSSSEVQSKLTVVVNLGWLTILAAVELAGLRFVAPPGGGPSATPLMPPRV